METCTSTERRLVLRILECWQEVRGDRDFPQAVQFSEELLGEDWAWCVTVDLCGDPQGTYSMAEFRHIGRCIRGVGGLAEPGMKLADCPTPSLLAATVAYIARVLDRQVPISMGGRLDLEGQSLLYRSILLPLSRDGSAIDGLLGAANFRPIRVDEDVEI